MIPMKFSLGQCHITPGARELLNDDQVKQLLRRHVKGDWGDLGEEDRRLNDEAIESGDRIFSMYKVNRQKIYVITEHDRSYTTIMLAEEY